MFINNILNKCVSNFLKELKNVLVVLYQKHSKNPVFEISDQ